MINYIFVQDNKIIGKGQAKCLNDNVLNVEVSKEIYDESEKYIFKDGTIVLNPNYEEEQKQKERERIDKLSLTAADVERAIYKAKNIDFDDILELVKDNPEIDIKALKIELKANNFYRGNPYINKIGALLGLSEKQLDEFFEKGDYEVLLAKIEDANDRVVL